MAKLCLGEMRCGHLMPDLRNSNLARIMDGKHVTKNFDCLRWTADAAAGISRGIPSVLTATDAINVAEYFSGLS